MIPATKSIQYQPDSITCIAQAMLVIPLDSVLLNTLPPAAALKALKGSSLVWRQPCRTVCTHCTAPTWGKRDEIQDKTLSGQILSLTLVSAYRLALSKHPFSIPPVQPNQMLWDPWCIFLSFHGLRGNGEEEQRGPGCLLLLHRFETKGMFCYSDHVIFLNPVINLIYFSTNLIAYFFFSPIRNSHLL